MKKLFIIFLLISACVTQNKENYLSDNLDKKNFDFYKEYSFKEYGEILEKYNAKTGYPKVN